MDVQSWYHNDVDEEIKGSDSRNKLKHSERPTYLFHWDNSPVPPEAC